MYERVLKEFVVLHHDPSIARQAPLDASDVHRLDIQGWWGTEASNQEGCMCSKQTRAFNIEPLTQHQLERKEDNSLTKQAPTSTTQAHLPTTVRASNPAVFSKRMRPISPTIDVDTVAM